MAQVTVELRKLLQLNNFELFDFPYEFDDPKFRAQIEQSVIDYYYNYEIGTETPDEFKRRFQAKWLSFIDYYNLLYNTTLLTYNPLINYKMTEALEQLATSNNTQNSVSDTTSNATTSQEGTDVLRQSTSTDNTRTDNLTSESDSITTTDNTSESDSTRTDNLKAVTTDSSEGSGNEKTSDYPQQAIAGGDFLEGEKTSTTSTSGTSTTDNTGTQTNTGSTINTGTQTNAGTITNTGTQNTVSTGTNDSTTTSDNTSVSEDSANTTGSLTSNGTANTSYEKAIEGLTGTSYQELIAKERQNLIRLIPMIISELKPLFILVY